MALTPAQAALSIAVMAGVTFLTRFLPFLLFDRGGKPPRIVLYLGRVLPPASGERCARPGFFSCGCATTSSTSVFQAPQSGQRPIHFGV